jgi:hypothetical protein
VTGGFTGPERAAQIEFSFGEQTISSSERWPGQLWSIETDVVTVPPGRHTLQWGSVGEGAEGVGALLVAGAGFAEAAEE